MIGRSELLRLALSLKDDQVLQLRFATEVADLTNRSAAGAQTAALPADLRPVASSLHHPMVQPLRAKEQLQCSETEGRGRILWPLREHEGSPGRES